MNGRELIAALCGQENIVVIRRPFVAWLGHVSDALLLDQAMYWQDRAGDGEWWHQSDEDMSERICIPVRSLKRSRVRLAEAGLIKTIRKGIPPRIHYQVDLQAAVDGLTASLAKQGQPAPTVMPTGPDSRANRPPLLGQMAQSSIEGGVKVTEGKSKAVKPPTPTASRGSSPRRQSPWSDFVQRVLDDYSVAATKGNCSAAGVAVANAQKNGLTPDDAAREWSAWMDQVRSEGRQKYLPIYKAGNAWASEWLLGERRDSEAIVIEGGIL